MLTFLTALTPCRGASPSLRRRLPVGRITLTGCVLTEACPSG
jgi:hypothetical protein